MFHPRMHISISPQAEGEKGPAHASFGWVRNPLREATRRFWKRPRTPKPLRLRGLKGQVVPAGRFVAFENRADLHHAVFSFGLDPGAVRRCGLALEIGVVGAGFFQRDFLPVQARPTEGDIHLRDTGFKNLCGAIDFDKSGVPRPKGKLGPFKAQTADFRHLASGVLDAAVKPGAGLALHLLGFALLDAISVAAFRPLKGAPNAGKFAFVASAFDHT